MQSVASETSICEIFCSASWGGTYDNPWQCEALVHEHNRRILETGATHAGVVWVIKPQPLPCEEKVNCTSALA